MWGISSALLTSWLTIWIPYEELGQIQGQCVKIHPLPSGIVPESHREPSVCDNDVFWQLLSLGIMKLSTFKGKTPAGYTK